MNTFGEKEPAHLRPNVASYYLMARWPNAAFLWPPPSPFSIKPTSGVPTRLEPGKF